MSYPEHKIQEDLSVLKDIIDGNEKSLEILFKKYYSFLVRFSLQIVAKSDAAEDIVQEVFIKLWDKRNSLEGVKNIKAYLFQATKNSSINWVNSPKNRDTIFHQENIIEDGLYLNETEEQISFEETQKKIQNALLKLPAKCKEVFMLSREDGKSYKEIAKALSISIKTVENQMGKALKILREELGLSLFILFVLSSI